MARQTRERSFDELARGLASGSISRGRALRLMGAALVGGTLGSFGIGGVAVAAKACKPAGQKCSKDKQCCSANCSGGTCAACPSGATLCGTECCQTGATCVAGTCCPNAQVCGTGTSLTCCPSGQECADGVCRQPCLPGGGFCNLDSQCCSGSCDIFAFKCNACQSSGNPCAFDSQCCSGTCLEETCTGCRPLGAPCIRGSQCCSGTCSGIGFTCV